MLGVEVGSIKPTTNPSITVTGTASDASRDRIGHSERHARGALDLEYVERRGHTRGSREHDHGSCD